MSSAVEATGESDADAVTREAVERLKSEVPDLCMWIYAAKGINEGTGVPDTYDNTVSTMQLIIEMLSSETKENVRPAAAQRRGWDAGILAKRADTEAVLGEVDAMVAKITESISTLNEVTEQLDIARALVELKYKQTFAKLDEIANSVIDGGYEGPDEIDELVKSLEKQVRDGEPARRAAKQERRRITQEEAREAEESESSSSSSSGSYYSSSEDEEEERATPALGELFDSSGHSRWHTNQRTGRPLRRF